MSTRPFGDVVICLNPDCGAKESLELPLEEAAALILAGGPDEPSGCVGVLCADKAFAVVYFCGLAVASLKDDGANPAECLSDSGRQALELEKAAKQEFDDAARWVERAVNSIIADTPSDQVLAFNDLMNKTWRYLTEVGASLSRQPYLFSQVFWRVASARPHHFVVRPASE